MNRKSSAKRLVGVSVGLGVMLALIAGFCMHWLATAQAVNVSDSSTLGGPTVAAPTVAATASDNSSDSNDDGTQRQTARPWTGPATQFDYPNRERTLQIEWVMDALKIGPGSVVGDIGAGGGWFTLHAARRVGPKGIVYAEEILPKYTEFIAQRARKAGLANVRTILGTTTDPKLPLNRCDAVLILNAYHEFDKPLAMLKKIRAGMKPNGRLAFIERDDEQLRREAQEAYAKTGKIKRRVDERPDQNPITDDHRLAREIVEREAASVGFKRVLAKDLGDDHYLVIVTPAPTIDAR
ncbi:MAG TPA: class I SAM-dependent methyltransferase [Abditibacteriaceae bacterium]